MMIVDNEIKWREKVIVPALHYTLRSRKG